MKPRRAAAKRAAPPPVDASSIDSITSLLDSVALNEYNSDDREKKKALGADDEEVFGDTIGQGAYSRVRIVECSDGVFAAKLYNAKISNAKIEKEAKFLLYVACRSFLDRNEAQITDLCSISVRLSGLREHGARCSNIVRLQRAVCSENRIYMELATRGSLFELLYQINSSKSSGAGGGSRRPSRAVKASSPAKVAVHPLAAELKQHQYQIIKDIVYGVHYLHTVARYAHLDLASKNVLVCKLLSSLLRDSLYQFQCNYVQLFVDWTAKLCDFHLALPIEGEDIKDAKGFGTLQWQAPELIKKKGKPLPYIISEKADIYGLGVIMWEVIHAKPAWSDYVEADTKLKVLSVCSSTCHFNLIPSGLLLF
jgi:serine/threonine protein kinase